VYTRNKENYTKADQLQTDATLSHINVPILHRFLSVIVIMTDIGVYEAPLMGLGCTHVRNADYHIPEHSRIESFVSPSREEHNVEINEMSLLY